MWATCLTYQNGYIIHYYCVLYCTQTQLISIIITLQLWVQQRIFEIIFLFDGGRCERRPDFFTFNRRNSQRITVLLLEGSVTLKL